VKKIILHIGVHKTGTTTFQQHIRKNSLFFRNANFYIPEEGKLNYNGIKVNMGSSVGGVHAIPHCLKNGLELTPLDAFLNDFEESGAENGVMSSEGFDDLSTNNVLLLRERLKEYDVTPVLVVRHPLHLAASLYCSKGAVKKQSPDKFLRGLYKRNLLNYSKLISDWSCFGKVEVLKFEEFKDINEALLDFIGMPKDLNGTKSTVRKSLPAYAAIAMSDFYNAFHPVSQKDFINTAYPYVLEFMESFSCSGKKEDKLLFSLNEQEDFLLKWRRMLDHSEESFSFCFDDSDYYSLPSGLARYSQEDVEYFKISLLKWVFNEKMPPIKIKL